MIVKNETPVLGRLLDSLKDVVDDYVIVDTGSSDGTPAFIQQKMASLGIIGEVHRHEWVNFGFNRDQALQYVYKKGHQGWVLFIDADEEFACSDPLFYKKLRPGVSYQLEKHHGEIAYALTNLVDVSQTRWEWRGVVHEYLHAVSGPTEPAPMPLAWIIFHEGEGVRSRGIDIQEKFLRDARLLEEECRKHPQDARSRFYLAQSYRDANQWELAYQQYQIRASMSGWAEETFIAQLNLGNLAARLNKPDQEVVHTLLIAYAMRATRAEPLHDLAVYYRKKQQYQEAYAYAKQASLIAMPNDRLFVSKAIYQWRILDELAVAAYWVGDYRSSKDAGERILRRQRRNEIQLNEQDIRRIQENLNFTLTKIAENPLPANKESSD